MALDTNSQVKAPLQPWTILVKVYDPGTFVVGELPVLTDGDFLPVDIQSIVQTSDASPGSMVFTMNDPETTIGVTQNIPAIGSEILAKASNVGDEDDEWGDGGMNVIFRGYVTGISHQYDDNGSVYVIECTDMKGRLGDEVITRSYNQSYNAAEALNFDSSGTALLDDELWTVEKIVRDIMYVAENQIHNIAPSLEPVVFFKWFKTIQLTQDFYSFDFSQVSDLKDYVPENLVFENTTLLEAIYRTISSAGTYRMVYNPRTDKIVFTKVSIEADQAGDLRNLYFAKHDKTDPNKDYVYDDVTAVASGIPSQGRVNVIKDNSVRKTSDSISIFRVTGAPIQWYSGHFFISESKRDMALSRNPSGVYHFNNYNWDGYRYQFSKIRNGDSIKVGLPLYPQWDPAKGYEAYEETSNFVKLFYPSTKAISSGFAYQGIKEKQGITVFDATYSINDAIISRVAKNYNVAQGYIYEAWYPYAGHCIYCEGSGAVEDRSPWGDNPDEFFGDSRDYNGLSSRPPLTPFDYQFVTQGGETVPTRHPVPWDNTCPACRGVGIEPRYKIRNIASNLVDLKPSETKVEDILMTPSGSLYSWEDLVSQYSYSYPFQIQIESTLLEKEHQVNIALADMPAHPLAGIYSNAGVGTKAIFASNKKISGIHKTAVEISETPMSIDFKRGNIIFESKHSILCKKEMKFIRTHLIDGVEYQLRDGEAGNSPIYDPEIVDGKSLMSYWRPARVWMIYYFGRPRYYRTIPTYTTSDFDPVERTGRNPATIPAPSGSSGDYYVKFAIMNDRPVYEIYKKKPTATEFSLRPKIRGVNTEDFVWQISPFDVDCLPVPSGHDYEFGGALHSTFEDRKYYFKTGTFQTSEGITQLEANLITGLPTDDIMRSDPFPKNIEWAQRDDRYRMIATGIRELDKSNDVQISGNVIVRGNNYDISNGLGYVRYEDGINAVVVKMVHNFSGGAYTTMMELSTEEFRLGERTEKEKDSDAVINKLISKGLIDPVNKKQFLNEIIGGKKKNKETNRNVRKGFGGGLYINSGKDNE
jgi:hypothetical protein